jgi:hypothetical protein
MPRCRNSYKTNRKNTKNTTLSQKIKNKKKKYFGTVATAWYFFYFFYWFLNCCDSVVFFVFFLLVLELLRQRGIFCIVSIGFGTVAISSYFFYLFFPKPIEKIPRCRNSYTTNRKNTKNTKLSQQFQNQ